MKLKILQFRHPIPIIQLFVNENIYGKEHKSFELRKDNLEWKNVFSNKAYCIDNQFYIDEKLIELPDFKKCNLIIIVNTQQGENKILCVNMLHNVKFYIFRLVLKEEQLIVELDAKDTWFNIPKRDIFKLFDFPPKQIVEIKFNAKNEMRGLSTMGERRFKVQHFIFQYLGEFKDYQLFRQPCPPIEVIIPKIEKTIDLIKPLW